MNETALPVRDTSRASVGACRGDREASVRHPARASRSRPLGLARRFPPVALMLDTLLDPRHTASRPAGPALFAAHERAAGAIARLDQALDHHPFAAGLSPPGAA